MKKLIAFPSIEPFRSIVFNINKRYNFVGLDENGDAIYDQTLPKPVIKFKGTVKLHGTNAGVGHDPTDGLWVQSRSNVITPLSDNAGFATFVMSKEDLFKDMFDSIRQKENGNIGDNDGLVIFGEWAGGSIQKGVAITGIEKSFFIFDVKVVPEDGSDSYYIESDYLKDTDNRIFNIEDYLSYHIEIDFNRPDLAQAKMIEITDTVEKLCPVGKAFGIEGVGEGVVWTTTYKGAKLRFKVKGEKHAGKSKVKTLNPVDSEKIGRIHELVNEIVSVDRMAQQLALACDTINGGTIDRKFLGDYIRMVISDTMEEEMDLILESGFEPKDINKYISELARKYWFEQEKL